MAGLTIAGWAAVAWWWNQGPGVPTTPEPPRTLTPLPPPDDSPPFPGLLDRTEMTPRDNAAYAALLQRVRGTNWETLDAESRRDVAFAQLVGNPERYRGLPIHLVGTLKRVIRQDVSGSKLFPDGVYYEGYAVTPDSGSNPWVLAFENLPAGVAVGPAELSQPITFEGYFLKLWAYEGGIPYEGDTPRPERRFRYAPLLIGRFPPAPLAPPAAPGRDWTGAWPLVLLGVVTLYFGVRLLMQLTRMQRRAVPRTFRRTIVDDTIEPERLSAWVEGQNEVSSPAPPNGQPGDPPDAGESEGSSGLRGI